jgi:ABC-2 type transport system permease protein
MNWRAVRAIYVFEMSRTARTLAQSIVFPVLSTSLYFIVFGAAIGARMPQIDTVSYGTFIVPGLTMMMILMQSITNASFGIYFPRFIGTIYEILSAPVSSFEVTLGYVGAAATKSLILGVIVLATAGFFVPLQIAHPFWMVAYLILSAAGFSLFGFILGIWAEGFEKLQLIPLLIITPLTFLGGTFYSIDALPPFWQKVSLFNPIVYLISGFRWSFFELSDVAPGISLAMTLAFCMLCMAIVWWIFHTGYKLKK